ncbi:Hypothetical predicted protein [Mytilus galloprovincialis]|uniref:Uncharacterized protein n=1 Tax=Mytilus galloprovincialis TaxID=29158 RepID=A0A8B6HP85_MYTGA|nr:Hypothetical predicted protein [Mytilus galloprovincialis]
MLETKQVDIKNVISSVTNIGFIPEIKKRCIRSDKSIMPLTNAEKKRYREKRESGTNRRANSLQDVNQNIKVT